VFNCIIVMLIRQFETIQMSHCANRRRSEKADIKLALMSVQTYINTKIHTKSTNKNILHAIIAK